MNQNIHIIQKQRYEIKTRKQKTALDIQNRLEDINTRYVLPVLAEKMDKYFFSDEVVTIDKLELDIGKINANFADEDWAKKILEHLDNQLKQAEAGNKNRKQQKHKHLVESWTWFLKNGILPAGIYNSINEIKKDLQTLDENGKKMLKSFLFYEADDNAILRLASTDVEIRKIHLRLLAPEVNIDWMNLIITDAALGLKEKISSPAITETYYNQVLWQDITRHFILNKGKIISTEDVIRQLKKKTTELSETGKSNLQNLRSKEEELFEKQIDNLEKLTNAINDKSARDEGIFISNAGICLLAPWLPSFFKKTGLITENNFADKWKQQHAIYLLHYLVTNEEYPTEELLIFPKLLSGWPLQMPVINSYQITEQEKTECEDLLRSIIENWEVLKNTSTKGLQGSFLQRSGKLIEQDDQFVLQPEQQSIDLLLEYVPWTFRFILLPWMKKAIQIDWY